MPHDARVVLALAIWMATWWMTEAVPLSVTALLPLVVLPPFSGLGFRPRSHHPTRASIVFLFMGGFMLGLACSTAACTGASRSRCWSWSAPGSGSWFGGFMLVTRSCPCGCRTLRPQ